MLAVVRKTLHISRTLAASLLLTLLCACSFYDYSELDIPTNIANGNQYINLSIVVSTGAEGVTRAEGDPTPKGGEDGDGREIGLDRENEVTGITLMLYKDDGGINTSSEETTLSFIAYYPVTLVSRPGEEANTEATYTYTTGNRSLENSGLKLNEEYHAIVVANADLTSKFTTSSKVTDVRDHLMTEIYTGTGIGADATHFVMSSESDDYTINFTKPDNKETTTNGETYFYFNKGIIIERLAARVDFWTKGATYNAERKGYEYEVTGGSKDKFVLTAVTPFNLYNNQTEEYLIKRLGNSEGSKIEYLLEEPANYNNNQDNQEIYVLDPYTLNKSTIPTPLYDSPLSAIIIDNSDKKMEMSTFQEGGKYKDARYTTANEDNLIVCYPKENTLLKDCPLYDYATGLCIEGDYYKNGERTHYTYYGYLRHQGEQTEPHTYPIYEAKDLDKTEPSEFPMNFGVVRNNIYRISIDGITEKQKDETPEIKLQIKVKKWDTFTHSTIYM